jgi:hypothetical protein
MLDDVLLETGNNWRASCDAFGFEKEEYQDTLRLRQKADKNVRVERHTSGSSTRSTCSSIRLRSVTGGDTDTAMLTIRGDDHITT